MDKKLSSAFHIKNVRHTGIVVESLEESLAFYIECLGLETSVRMDESGVFIDKILGLDNVDVTTVKMKTDDGQMIELLDFKSHKKDCVSRTINDIGPTHVAFTVDDLDLLYDRFRKKGIEFLSNPEVSVDGGVKVAFCVAPEGTYIELVELLPKERLVQ